MEYLIPPTHPPPLSLRSSIFSEKNWLCAFSILPLWKHCKLPLLFIPHRSVKRLSVLWDTKCLNVSPQESVFSRQSEGRMKTEKLESANKFVSKDKSCICYFLLWRNPKYLRICILYWVSGKITQQAWELFIVFLWPSISSCNNVTNFPNLNWKDDKQSTKGLTKDFFFFHWE